jgi:hypothetical protein
MRSDTPSLSGYCFQGTSAAYAYAPRMSDLEAEIKELLSGHRLSREQIQHMQQGAPDADTLRRLQRMLANTQNALLRLAREIDELRAQ